ncbi:hypothetical protein GQ55_5G238200 [Panicum hallii var. hallii]|uniref:Uncharacterized protein n=1 Tax=Panicum hallii var. hallii TaxID=1504633 RepID=A0A2T7DJJ8_9POAL|nr:hypothetical protein GQ55_5G238200 [Panicum hallii var. hallii]
MSRKRHDLGRADGSGAGRHGSSSSSSKALVWDTGSSLYDSYELAAVRRLLDGRLLAAGASVLPLPDEPPAAAEPGGENKQIVVAARARSRKVTLRALFRAVAAWAARPRQAPLACACAGKVHGQGGAVVEPDVPSHGQL